MGSVQNWLGFSPSPHLTIDMAQESSRSQSSSCIVHSNVQESSIGFDQLTQNTPTLHMPDGSLYILDSLNRTHNEGWHKSLEHSRTMDTDADLQSQHSINADLSMLVGGRGDHLCSSSPYDDHIVQNNSEPEGQGPKLEDFLGGASSGEEHYSHGRSEVQTSGLEDMYGTAPSFNDVDPLAIRMIVADSRLTLRGVPNCLPSFDIADSEISTSCKSSQQTEDQSLKAAANRFLNDSYDQNSKNEYIFRDCSLRLPQSSGVNNMNELSTVKTWLKNHASVPESNYTAAPKGGLGMLTNIQSLSLSMSTSSQSSSLIVPSQNSILDTSLSENKKRSPERTNTSDHGASRKSIDTFGQRTSVYRGVTRHRWTGRYEAHLWDNSCRREGQTRKGRQVYLGGYDKEEKAARAYDLAALKYWGLTTTTNFPVTDYEKELEQMKHMTRQEYVASLRRKSSGFSRGASVYRGVTRHHQHGRWQARIGRVAGNKDLYLGTFSTQEEAAEAYDIAAIKFRGLNAVTNFDMSRYDVKSILASSTLPVGGHVKRIKESSQPICDPSVDGRRTDEDINSYTTSYSNSNGSKTGHEWPLNIAFEQQANQQRSSSWCKPESLDHYTNHNPEHLHVQLHPLQHQKFLQPEPMATTNATVLHNLMTAFESPAVDIHNNIASSSTSGLFSNNVSSDLAGNGLLMAISPSLQCGADHNSLRAPFNQNKQGTHNNNLKASAYENVIFGDTCSRSVYYLPPPQSSVHAAKGNSNLYENAYNNWMTIPSQSSLAPRNNLAAVCHAPIFSIWSDT